jgi:monoamine oxidase
MREVKADMIGYTCELMAKAIDQSALDAPLTAEDKERFVTFLVNQGYLDSADRAYKKTAARGPGDPHDFRALLQSGFGTRIRSVIEGTGMAPMFQPVGGMDQFPKALSAKAGRHDHTWRRSRLDPPVDRSREGVYKNLKTGAMTEVSADYCVSCLPLTILSRLDVNLSPRR